MKSYPSPNTLARILLCVVLGLATASSAWAQSNTGNGSDPAMGRSMDEDTLLGNRLAQEAIYALSGSSQPREDQLTRAAILMDLALERIPDDAELWRLRGELAGRRNNQDKRLEALSQYARLRPKDDAAQFQLVRSRVEKMETLDQRLGAIERVLNSAGDQWSRPLRSRLSSYAAAAAKEMGDMKRFTKHLKSALDLDSANETAAAMAVDYVRSQNANARQLGTVTINLVRALPTDGSARLSLAELLIGEAAYERGAQQYRLAYRLAPGLVPPRAYRSWMLALGASGQTDQAMQLLDELKNRSRQRANAAKSSDSNPKSPSDSDQPQSPGPKENTSPNPNPETSPSRQTNTQPPLDLELMRLAILSQGDSENQMDAAFERISARLGQSNQTPKSDKSGSDKNGQTKDSGGADQPEQTADQPGEETTDQSAEQPAAQNPNQPADQTMGQSVSRSQNPKLDLAWLAAVFNRNQPSTTQLLQGIDTDDPRVNLARGWLAVHAKRPQEAKRLLQPLAQSEPLAALGLATLKQSEEADDGQTRGQALSKVVHDYPRTLAALLASLRLQAMDQPSKPTSAGQAVVDLMDRHRSSLWQMEPGQLSWINLNLEIEPVRFALAEPIRGDLTIRNSSQIALALGAGRAVNTRTMLIAQPSIAGKPVAGPVRIVVDAGRRLTLDAGQSLTVPVRMKRSALGRIADRYFYQTLAFSTLGVLNPRINRRGAVRPGLLGAKDRVTVNQVRGLPITAKNIDRWITDLASSDTLTRLQALARLARLTPRAGGQSVAQDQLAKVTTMLNERFKKMSAQDQAWTLLYLPPPNPDQDGQQGGGRYQPMLDIARQSDNPTVRIAYLKSQVHRPDAQALNAALSASNRKIRNFASALKTGLTNQSKTPSTNQTKSQTQ